MNEKEFDEFITSKMLFKKIMVDYLEKTIEEWKIKEIPPNNECKIRKVIFERDETDKFEE